MEAATAPRQPYPSDMTDDEWAFVAPYLTLMTPDAPQRRSDLRVVVNGARWTVRAGAAWRMMPHDLPPWRVVSEQLQRWIAAGCFERMVQDLRAILRWGEGRADDPTAAILDSRTVRSTPASGGHGGDDGHKRRRMPPGRSKVHAAVDTLGHLLALHVTPVNAQDRDQVGVLAAAVQDATGETVEIAYVDEGSSGERAEREAAAAGIGLIVVRLPGAKRGFDLLPRRWVVERSFARAARCRRLARDYERLPETVVGLHFLAFACLMPRRLVNVVAQSP
jgi:transposase